MFFLDSSNNRYYVGQPFEYNGIRYAARGATEQKFVSLGFNKVTIQARPDSRFHIVSQQVSNTGTYTVTDIPLADLKEKFVKETKATERSILSRTDYYLVQNFEDSTAYPIPTVVTNFRAAVRAASTARCNEINAVTTVNSLKDLIVNQNGLTVFPAEPDQETTDYTTY